MTAVQQELGFVVDEDAETRASIVDDLGETLFVEAGAGSGKTKSLVDRVVALVVAVCRCERSWRSPSPRRRRRSSATGSAASSNGWPPRTRRRAMRTRRARRRRGVHAARVRAAPPHGTPDRSGSPASDRGARRHRITGRLRGALDTLRRPPARRRRARTRALARAQCRHAPRHPAHDRPRLQRELGPRRGTHARRARPTPARRRGPGLGPAGRVRARRLVQRPRRQARTRPRGARRLARPVRAGTRRVRATPAAHRGPPEVPLQPGEEGQLALHVRRRARAVASRRRAQTGGERRGDGHRGHPAPARVGDRPVHTARGRRTTPHRPPRVPRPAGAVPRPSSGTRNTAGTFGGASGPATHGCCSTSSRTPIRSRSTSLRSLASADPRRPRSTLGRDRDRPRPAVRRRRSEAVDLPVPPRRHRHVPRGARSAFGAAPRHLTRNFRTDAARWSSGSTTCSAS